MNSQTSHFCLSVFMPLRTSWNWSEVCVNHVTISILGVLVRLSLIRVSGVWTRRQESVPIWHAGTTQATPTNDHANASWLHLIRQTPPVGSLQETNEEEDFQVRNEPAAVESVFSLNLAMFSLYNFFEKVELLQMCLVLSLYFQGD